MPDKSKLLAAHRRLWIAAGFLVLLVGAGWGLVHWQNDRAARAIVEAHLPEQPVLRRDWPGAFERRLDNAERAGLNGPDRVDGLARLAALYHANGFAGEAIACYEAWLALEPDAPKAAYRLAVLLAGYGRMEEALPLLDRVIGGAPGYLEAPMQKANILLKLNRVDEAEALFHGVLAKDDRTQAWTGLAQAASQNGKWEKARQYLEKAVSLQPGFSPAWSALATAYERLGLTEKARGVRELGHGDAVTGELPDPWMDELMSSCFDVYRLRVAAFAYLPADPQERAHSVRLLERALSLGADRASTLRDLGRLCRELGQMEAARGHLEEAVKIAPDDSDAWTQLLQVYQSAGNRSGVQYAIEQGLAHNPDSPALLQHQGRWLAEQQRYAEALAAFDASRRERPEEAPVYIEIARILFRLGRIDEGLAEMQRALEVSPEHPLALSLLTLHAIQSGDQSAADAWLRRARAQVRVPREDLADLERQYQAAFGSLAP